MDTKKRALYLCVLSFIGGIAWFIADVTERGLTIGTFGGPVLVLGIIGIPSLVDYIKASKK